MPRMPNAFNIIIPPFSYQEKNLKHVKMICKCLFLRCKNLRRIDWHVTKGSKDDEESGREKRLAEKMRAWQAY